MGFLPENYLVTKCKRQNSLWKFDIFTLVLAANLTQVLVLLKTRNCYLNTSQALTKKSFCGNARLSRACGDTLSASSSALVSPLEQVHWFHCCVLKLFFLTSDGIYAPNIQVTVMFRAWELRVLFLSLLHSAALRPWNKDTSIAVSR
jgi:hypothetical protein